MPQGMQAFLSLIFLPPFRPRQAALAGRGSHQSDLRKRH